MNDKELWKLISIISEGQDSEQRREVEQYITDLQKEIERLNKENEVLKKIQCTFLGTGCKEEIERLNNIINELEKWLENEIKFRKVVDKDFELRKALNILQILKGSE